MPVKSIRILAFSGSARRGSWNQMLVALCADAVRAAGAGVTLVNLRDFQMPLFHEDLELDGGTPQAALDFKRLLLAHDGMLIATPEYNSTLTPLLKNTIDWASREDGDTPMLGAFKDTTAALLSASPGRFGGARSLVQLRRLLEHIKVDVVAESFSLPEASDAFREDGGLRDAGHVAAVRAVAAALVEALRNKIPE